ncbi:hypothetical protein BY458DRAFT_496738 [Sporodiniella umbellata]|nr:hypothetical protein BY458DRAFT_496738 [Sporodiniella umbellata]
MSEGQHGQESGHGLKLGRPTTGADIGELQQKISQAEQELSSLKSELEQTRALAKQSEVSAQESGKTNRKLKTEIQTLTDMSNRKDRQAENSKATAFFFEGQVKKYMDEIENARQGMGHLKELDDQLNQAKKEQTELEKSSKEEVKRVRGVIKSLQESHQREKEAIKQDIEAAYAELEKTSAHTSQLQKEIQQKMESELQSGTDLSTLEKEHRLMTQKQTEAVRIVQEEIENLKKKLEQSEAYTISHEDRMLAAKEEMDRIVRRLRAIDQIPATESAS